MAPGRACDRARRVRTGIAAGGDCRVDSGAGHLSRRPAHPLVRRRRIGARPKRQAQRACGLSATWSRCSSIRCNRHESDRRNSIFVGQQRARLATARAIRATASAGERRRCVHRGVRTHRCTVGARRHVASRVRRQPSCPLAARRFFGRGGNQPLLAMTHFAVVRGNGD